MSIDSLLFHTRSHQQHEISKLNNREVKINIVFMELEKVKKNMIVFRKEGIK